MLVVLLLVLSWMRWLPSLMSKLISFGASTAKLISFILLALLRASVMMSRGLSPGSVLVLLRSSYRWAFVWCAVLVFGPLSEDDDGG